MKNDFEISFGFYGSTKESQALLKSIASSNIILNECKLDNNGLSGRSDHNTYESVAEFLQLVKNFKNLKGITDIVDINNFSINSFEGFSLLNNNLEKRFKDPKEKFDYFYKTLCSDEFKELEFKTFGSEEKCLTAYLESLNKDITTSLTFIKKIPETKEQLKELCNNLSINLGEIDTSKITDMSKLFYESERKDFSGIETWDVSNVTDMAGMFMHSQFNGDLSNWDVSSVTDMSNMFEDSQFNGDISKWDVSSVTDMRRMFDNSHFNGDLSNWDVSNVTDMGFMFRYSQFNGDISKWDVSNVTDMNGMFDYSQFNGDISNWNISDDTEIEGIFKNCPISKENVPDLLKKQVANEQEEEQSRGR